MVLDGMSEAGAAAEEQPDDALLALRALEEVPTAEAEAAPEEEAALEEAPAAGEAPEEAAEDADGTTDAAAAEEAAAPAAAEEAPEGAGETEEADSVDALMIRQASEEAEAEAFAARAAAAFQQGHPGMGSAPKAASAAAPGAPLAAPAAGSSGAPAAAVPAEAAPAEAPAEAAPAEAQEESIINSTSERNSYMRFLRVMKRRDTAANYPSLVEKFKDAHSGRAALFKDWFESGENLAETVLTIKKKLTNAQRGELKYKKLTKDDLMVKYHDDEDYIETIMNDCWIKGLWSRDPYTPQDDEKIKYWILDEESLTLSRELADSVAITGTMDVETGAEANAITEALGSTGSFGELASFTDLASFGAEGESWWPEPASSWSDTWWSEPTSKGKGKNGKGGKGKNGKNGKTGKNGKGGKGKDGKGKDGKSKNAINGQDGKGKDGAGKGPGNGKGGDGKGNTGEGDGDGDSKKVELKDPIKEAKALMAKLATGQGKIKPMLLQMRHMQVSSTLVAQLEKLSEALEKCYGLVHDLVRKNQTEGTAMNTVRDRATECLKLYESKCKYSRALLNVKKREDARRYGFEQYTPPPPPPPTLLLLLRLFLLLRGPPNSVVFVVVVLVLLLGMVVVVLLLLLLLDIVVVALVALLLLFLVSPSPGSPHRTRRRRRPPRPRRARRRLPDARAGCSRGRTLHSPLSLSPSFPPLSPCTSPSDPVSPPPPRPPSSAQSAPSPHQPILKQPL